LLVCSCSRFASHPRLEVIDDAGKKYDLTDATLCLPGAQPGELAPIDLSNGRGCNEPLTVIKNSSIQTLELSSIRSLERNGNGATWKVVLTSGATESELGLAPPEYSPSPAHSIRGKRPDFGNVVVDLPLHSIKSFRQTTH
jgi:hypothetical protein